MILVIGVNSKISADLAQRLAERGEQVRALVRSEDSRARLEALGYEVVIGDLAHAASVDAAMLGVERVFLLSSPHADDVTWHQQAIDAANKGSSAKLMIGR